MVPVGLTDATTTDNSMMLIALHIHEFSANVNSACAYPNILCAEAVAHMYAPQEHESLAAPTPQS